MRLPRSRVASLRALLLATTIGAVPAVAGAQAGLTHADNAVPVPRGMIRFSAIPSWARYDSRFTGSGSGSEPLGSVLTSDALGTAELPALTRFESALRALTGDPNFRLSLGASSTFTSVRTVTTPISLEYGVTRWLSLGVMMPIVQWQRELILDVQAVDAIRNPQAGNVGPSAGPFDPSIYAEAAALAGELDAAASQLEQLMVTCTANPGAAGCSGVNADPGGAAATAAEARQVAASVRFVYGTSTEDPGIGLVPRASVSATIATRLQALNTRFAAYLGGTPIATQAPPAGAAGPVASGNVRDLARRGVEGLGPDSLARISDLAIGDVEVGARLLLWDSRAANADTSRPATPRARILVGALARLGTGQAASDDELFAVGAGDGQTDAEGMLAVDLDVTPRLGATVLARYTAQFGEIPATRLPDERGSLTPFGATRPGTRQPGDIVTLEVSPRYWLANSLFLAAHYGFVTRMDDSYEFPVTGVEDPSPLPTVTPLPTQATAGGYTEHRAGFSLSYSTVAEWERRRVRVPIEVSYTHLETFHGSSAMVPRAGRDQILLRLYYPLRR